MIERVVTTLDGSKRAELAVPYAAYVGAMLSSKMELVTVSDKAGGSVDSLDADVQRSLAEAEGLMGTWIREIETTVLGGDPAEAIVDHAGDSSTLVAMATHGRTGIMRRIAGSVAEEVLRVAHSPLLFVKADDNSANIRFAARIANVLLPLDTTDVAEGAIPAAKQLAEKLNAGVTLMNVSEDAQAVDYIDGVAKDFEHLKSPVEKVFHSGSPGEEIVKVSKAMSWPVVVMCSKRANVDSGSIRGSVTDYVVRHAESPVVVVPFSAT